MNIDELTVGQIKEIQSLTLGLDSKSCNSTCIDIDKHLIGKKVIIRTFSAGVWFGKLSEKSGSEVILRDARRLYRWWAAKSISLSGVALYGVKPEKSLICGPLPIQWLEAIEITPCSHDAISSIEGCEHVESI